MKFTISSEDSELLCLLEEQSNLRAIAAHFGRDVSVVSRRLQAMDAQYGLLEKENGRWRLTSRGLRYTAWVRSVMNEQERHLRSGNVVTIATTREFAARVLIPQLRQFKKKFGEIRIIGSDQGIESVLLHRRADIDFDCGSPYAPEIGFKKLVSESLVLVASPRWLEQNAVKNTKQLGGKTYLHYERNDLHELKEITGSDYQIGLTVSELNSLREALKEGLGWSFLPYYTIKPELEKGELKIIPGHSIDPTHFGVWWNQASKPTVKTLEFCMQWLKAQKL